MIRDPPIGFIVNVVYETMARLGVSPPEMKWEETWESIILPDGYTKPAKEVFEAKFQEIIREYSFKELRQERNRRLAEVDWIFQRIMRSMMRRTNNGSRTVKLYATFPR